MNLIMKISLFAAIFACQILIVFAQGTTTTTGKIVKWEAINGKDNEFILFLPEGYQSTVERDFNIRVAGVPGRGELVSKKLTVARYINGVVLMMQYYEGDAQEVQKILVHTESLKFQKEEEINGFQVKHFTGELGNRPSQVQHFLFKNRLYVLTAISNSENNRIVKIFFESVRLVNQNNTAAPNVPAGAASTNLARIVEREPVRIGDAGAIPSGDADRQPIILRTGRPYFTFDTRRGMSQGRLKMRVLFSSSGKVTKVEILESSSKLLERHAIEGAKDTVFIPAEKDGKLVSVYRVLEHSFGVSSY